MQYNGEPPFLGPGDRPYNSYEVDGEAIVQNVKTGATATFAGTVASAPVKAATLLSSKIFAAQMVYCTANLALQLALFGVIYRYAVRCDANDKVNIGIVIMFALCRAFSSVQVSTVSGKMTTDMWLQLGVYFGESILAFGVAAAAVEYAWDKGWARPLWYLEPDGNEAYLDEVDEYGRVNTGRGRVDSYYGGVTPTNAYGRGVTTNAYGRGPNAYERDSYGRGPYERDIRRR